MPQPGGSATLYGVLYQVLTNLDWALNVRMHDAVVDQDELLQVWLTLEPEGGGGDFRAELHGHRVVVQCKSRRTRRAWSLTDLVEDILPDLYLAIGPPPWDLEEAFVFLTEGRLQKDVLAQLVPEPVVAALRRLPNIAASEDEPTTRRKVDHLLGHFSIKPEVTLASLQADRLRRRCAGCPRSRRAGRASPGRTGGCASP